MMLVAVRYDYRRRVLKDEVSNMEERINELELRYMQQEHTIQELNDIVCRQELMLEQLRRDFATLKEQMMTMSPSVSGDSSQEESPPHY